MARKYNSPKRPVDKEQMFLTASSLGTSQDNQAIRTSTVAETFSGGHIQCSISKVSGGGYVQLALMIVPEGVSTPTLSTTDANPIAQPEEFVIWSASVYVGASSVETTILKDRIRTMRKMKNGDFLVLAMKSSASTLCNVTALVTAFFKQ